MSKSIRFFIVFPALLMVLLGISTFGHAPSAHAAPLGPCGGCTGGGPFHIGNARTNGTLTDVVIRLVFGPGTGGSITRSVTWSNSFNASISIPGDTVSAGLGFSVSVSGSDSLTCNMPTNTTNEDKTLLFEAIYNVWDFDIFDSHNIQRGSGVAYRYNHARCGSA